MATGTSTDTIQTIIFDLGGVIVDFEHQSICRGLARHCSLTPETIYTEIFDSGLERQFDLGHISPQSFSESVCSRIGAKIEPALFQKIWSDIFSVNPGTQKIIQALHGRYPLACLSNTNIWHFEFCRRRFAPLQSFQDFILSYQVGHAKPGREIFEEALRRTNFAPAECLCELAVHFFYHRKR